MSLAALDPTYSLAQKQIEGMPPEQAVMHLLSNGVDPRLASLVMKNRMLQQSAKTQGPPPTTTVAQDIDNQINSMAAQRSQGIAGMPVNPQMFGGAQGMAGGGIVSFAGGALVPEGQGFHVPNWTEVKDGAKSTSATLDELESKVRDLMGKGLSKAEATKKVLAAEKFGEKVGTGLRGGLSSLYPASVAAKGLNTIFDASQGALRSDVPLSGERNRSPMFPGSFGPGAPPVNEMPSGPTTPEQANALAQNRGIGHAVLNAFNPFGSLTNTENIGPTPTDKAAAAPPAAPAAPTEKGLAPLDLQGYMASMMGGIGGSGSRPRDTSFEQLIADRLKAKAPNEDEIRAKALAQDKESGYGEALAAKQALLDKRMGPEEKTKAKREALNDFLINFGASTYEAATQGGRTLGALSAGAVSGSKAYRENAKAFNDKQDKLEEAKIDLAMASAQHNEQRSDKSFERVKEANDTYQKNVDTAIQAQSRIGDQNTQWAIAQLRSSQEKAAYAALFKEPKKMKEMELGLAQRAREEARQKGEPTAPHDLRVNRIAADLAQMYGQSSQVQVAQIAADAKNPYKLETAGGVGTQNNGFVPGSLKISGQ